MHGGIINIGISTSSSITHHEAQSFSFCIPTQPLASTREHAVVHVGGAPTPINDLVRPCLLKVATRGVDMDGKGTALFTLEVRVMVDGVRDVVGEEGKTKRVCEGVGAVG